MQDRMDSRVYAGFFVRMVAYLIDSLIAFIVGGIIKAPFGLAAGAGLTALRANFIFQHSFIDVIGYVGMVSYFILMTYLTHTTLGKMLLNIEVVTRDGEWTFINILYRETVGRFLSDILCIGYLAVIVSAKKQGFHDMLCDTYVVYKDMQRVPAPEKTLVTANTAAPVKTDVTVNTATPMEASVTANTAVPMEAEMPAQGAAPTAAAVADGGSTYTAEAEVSGVDSIYKVENESDKMSAGAESVNDDSAVSAGTESVNDGSAVSAGTESVNDGSALSAGTESVNDNSAVSAGTESVNDGSALSAETESVNDDGASLVAAEYNTGEQERIKSAFIMQEKSDR